MSEPTTEATDARGPKQREGLLWILLTLAVVPWVLTTKVGWLAADTKAYLYLDPGKLLASAQSMWNPDIGMGGVTHQNIGYLFPMGPYYWLVHALGIPMWLGQRIWLSALLLAAGGGVLFVGRLLRLSPAGRFAGAMVYMLSPFLLDYITRSTALLMPWAGFGWMLGFTILGLRTRQWRWAAAFALVVAAVGGVNATSILFVGIAPLIWILYTAVLREESWRTAFETTFRFGLLSFVVSIWWGAGLWAEGAYGLNVLKYTETIPTVTMTSAASEIWRGLGFWYFYGDDRIQPWTLAAENYIAHALPMLLSFAVPALCVMIGFFARWRYRALSVLLIAAGFIFAVSAYPYDAPTPFGALLKAVQKSTVGLAMRSTNRVMPLVIMGLALLLGAGITAIGTRWPRWSVVIGALAALMAAANLSPLYEGLLIADNFQFPGTLPHYVTQAADYLNSTSPNTRVLGIPGADFGYYRYGTTIDPVWPGLLNRPWVSRGSVPVGETASANLVRALDTSIQDNVFDPETLAPMAQLMSAGDVLLQNDLQYERFAATYPSNLTASLTPRPPGLGTPVRFGGRINSDTIIGPLGREAQLDLPFSRPYPHQLAVYPVATPRALIRTEPTSAGLIVAGDGEGLLTAAAYGLLTNDRSIFYSASLDSKAAFASANSPTSTYVLTDSNAKRLDTFGTLQETYGYVQTANDKLLREDPSQQALGMFPNQGTDTQTIALLSGAKSITATSYGYPTANFPENQPFNAFDGDPYTAWEAGGVSNAVGEAVQIDLGRTVRADSLRFLQPLLGPNNRKVTTAVVTFDGGSPVDVTFSPSSYSLPGQTIHFAPRSFHTLRVTITGVTGSTIFQRGLSAVGFAEITIPGVPPATESLRLPTDLLTKAGPGSLSHPLDVLLHRLRASRNYPRVDPEFAMRRTVVLPEGRSFGVAAQFRVNDLLPDDQLNELLGRTTSTDYPAASAGAVHVIQTASSSRLAGCLRCSSWAALDADPTSAWQSAFTAEQGQWLSATLAKPVTLDHLNLRVLVDGAHAVPTQVTVSAGGQSRTVSLPNLGLGMNRRLGHSALVPIHFAPISGSTITLRIDAVRTFSIHIIARNGGLPSPVGIADLGIPGAVEPATPAQIPLRCSDGLLAANGSPVPLVVAGSTAVALDGGELRSQACAAGPAVAALHDGSNLITTADGLNGYYDVDTVALSSAPGGAAAGSLSGPGATSTGSATSPATPAFHLTSSNRWSAKGSLTGTGRASWLVLGQSLSTGWHATVDGRDLGAPVLIDGYAAGWHLPALPVGHVAAVSFTWTPQHVINFAELASLLGLIACVVLCIWPPRRRTIRRRLAWVAPTLDDPLSYAGQGRSWRRAAAWALAVGIVMGFFASPFGGLGAFALVLVGLRWPRCRTIAFLGAAGSIGIAGLYTVALQHLHAFPWDIHWPQHFPWAHVAGWAALVFLVADTVVETIRIRLRRTTQELADDEQSSATADS
jgi:arabinofuranan 3-O-arabinosyltransferase